VFDRDRNNNQNNAQGPRAGSPWVPGTPVSGLPGAVSTTQTQVREGFLTMSFVWMFLALLTSAAAALVVMSNQTALEFVAQNFFILFIVEIAVVFVISLAINRIGALVALALLFAYALLNGATISLVVLGVLQGSAGLPGVVSAFLGAAAIFGAAAIYGVVTKRDLTSLGGILFMGVIGLIVVSLINAFLFPSGVLSFAIGVVGVIIFTALTAYDVQRINRGELSWIKNRESASVVGALHLYLDFVNLFLMLLRIFSSRD
jgi:FtsH-binding integral membrane protein